MGGDVEMGAATGEEKEEPGGDSKGCGSESCPSLEGMGV